MNQTIQNMTTTELSDYLEYLEWSLSELSNSTYPDQGLIEWQREDYKASIAAAEAILDARTDNEET